jgi:hypothetical protein
MEVFIIVNLIFESIFDLASPKNSDNLCNGKNIPASGR